MAAVDLQNYGLDVTSEIVEFALGHMVKERSEHKAMVKKGKHIF